MYGLWLFASKPLTKQARCFPARLSGSCRRLVGVGRGLSQRSFCKVLYAVASMRGQEVGMRRSASQGTQLHSCQRTCCATLSEVAALSGPDEVSPGFILSKCATFSLSLNRESEVGLHRTSSDTSGVHVSQGCTARRSCACAIVVLR